MPGWTLYFVGKESRTANELRNRGNMAELWLGPLIFNLNPPLLQNSISPFSFPSIFKSKSKSLFMAASSAPISCPCSSPGSSPTPSQPSLLVFSGGTGFNGVVEELKMLTTRVAHVLPVSDDGGSTAEIVRVLGGPAVGDIRSRCLRLSDQSTAEALAVRRLLGHRLPFDAYQAKSEWYEIVEGEHSLWTSVSRPYRETIRAFLVYFQNEILRRASESFCFVNGSIGNFFFAGARIFFQSLDAAIFLFSRVSDIPPESLVLPVISTNDRLTLGCELWDGTIIRGQNEISHPVNSIMQPVNKETHSVPALPSRIKRVFYMSSEGGHLLHEVFPIVNSSVLDQLKCVDCIVYAMGSLFTSICPSLIRVFNLLYSHVHERRQAARFRNTGKFLQCLEMYGNADKGGLCISTRITAKRSMWMLATGYGPLMCSFDVLRGIGEIISSRNCPKVLLLNGSHDRETNGFSASCFVTAIADALNRKYGDPHNCLENSPSQYVNTLLVPKEGEIPVDLDSLATQGIFDVIYVDSIRDPKVGVVFNPQSLISALADLLDRYKSTNIN